MPRYKLRTLLILLAVGPPMLAGAWFVGSNAIADYRAKRRVDTWEVIGGPGAIASFQVNIICTVETEDEQPTEESP